MKLATIKTLSRVVVLSAVVLPLGVLQAAPKLGSCPSFPANAMFNTRIDDTQRYPTHASSAKWVSQIGNSTRFHADWGQTDDPTHWQDHWPKPYYGIPLNLIDGTSNTTTWPVVSFKITDPRAGNGDGVPDESDCAPTGQNTIKRGCDKLAARDRHFPYPNDNIIRAEHGTCNDAQECGDRHVLVVDQSTCRLWESYFSYKVEGKWFAYSTAAWSLRSNKMRPLTWTSGDAAGLPISPFLARVSEANSGTVAHALRVTFSSSRIRGMQWPARHTTSGGPSDGFPYGTVLRLKSSFVIPANWTTQAKALATAMKRYGLYVADIGSNFFVQGEPSSAWSDSTISQLQSISMAQMEFVDTSGLHDEPGFDPNSFANPRP